MNSYRHGMFPGSDPLCTIAIHTAVRTRIWISFNVTSPTLESFRGKMLFITLGGNRTTASSSYWWISVPYIPPRVLCVQNGRQKRTKIRQSRRGCLRRSMISYIAIPDRRVSYGFEGVLLNTAVLVYSYDTIGVWQCFYQQYSFQQYSLVPAALARTSSNRTSKNTTGTTNMFTKTAVLRKVGTEPYPGYFLGCYPYVPELLQVLHDIHTSSRNFCSLRTSVAQYPGYGYAV